MGRLDVDVGFPAGRTEGVAQRTGVVSRRVTREQRGHELVDGGHRSRVATTRYSVGPSSSSLMVSMAALTVAASSAVVPTWASRRSSPPRTVAVTENPRV